VTAASSKSIVEQDHLAYPTIPDRVPDRALVADFIITSALANEESRIGYGVLPKAVYLTWVRFGDLVKPLVPTILDDLVKQGLIIEAPFPRCYKRASPAKRLATA